MGGLGGQCACDRLALNPLVDGIVGAVVQFPSSTLIVVPFPGENMTFQAMRTQVLPRVGAVLVAITIGAATATVPALFASQMAQGADDACNYMACDLTYKYCFQTDVEAHCIGPTDPPEESLGGGDDDDIPACSSTRCKKGGGPD